MAELKEDVSDNQKRCGKFLDILLKMFIFLRYYLDLVVDTLFGFYYNAKREFVDSTNNPIILESAVSLATKIRKGELTSEKVVTAFIERIKEVNDVLNAMIDNRFEEAIKEAKDIDRDIATGQIIEVDFQLKPFLGVPFTTKESTACKGLSSTYGIVSRKNRKANADAEVVALMKKAGGILLGVTNIPPLNLWSETTNRLHGTTKNPYNTTRTTGGSSGGEASLLAACGTPLSIGTDIGGSIRIPCFMCGVFGHKPTSHLISTRGLTFRTGKEKDTIVVAGPMSRYAEDLTPLLKVLVGPNITKLKLDQDVTVKNIKFYYIEDPKDPFVSYIREEMRRIFRRTVNYFEEICNSEPEKVEFEEIRYAGKLWVHWMAQEEGSYKKDLTDREREVNAWDEILKFITMRSEHHPCTIYNLISDLLPKPNEDWAKEVTEKLKKQIIDTLGPNGVLLYPSAPFPASYHHTSFLRPWNFNLFSIFNALKLPVTQVPLGLGKDGLPLGIQVVTSPYNDHLSIAVAKELERAFGGYVPPFKCKTPL